MEMMASMRAQMNNSFDALDGKISDIQERVMRLEAEEEKKINETIWITKGMRKKNKKGVSSLLAYMHKISLKDDIQRSKRSLKITRLYEDEVIKILEEAFILKIIFEKLSALDISLRI
ncbi:hypothetical protein M9H77_34881 [Catharanthus roseus]|uniref:Uncharacterized protein n=1 Tax=Catharanthus roseus TaxID=4058 RepID=A0ACB9ZMF7_CATRO|nr:hypothetical protein M9H77_34881 [Catharanthus roseus]